MLINHIRLGTQYCDGLRGPLVVYDPDDPYKQLYDGQSITSTGIRGQVQCIF